MNEIAKDILMHIGMPRRSGRYPYGSGKDPYQHSGDFLARIKDLEEQNLTFEHPRTGETIKGEPAIAYALGIVDEFKNPSTGRLRTQIAVAKEEERRLKVDTAKRMREKEGKSLQQIAKEMGFDNDSSVRSLLNEDAEKRMAASKETAEFLKKQLETKEMIDVGKGVERHLRVSRDKLNQALYRLEMEGYPVYGGGVPQATNKGQQTNMKVLCRPGIEHKEIYDYGRIQSVANEYTSEDNGVTYHKKFEYPSSIDSSRIMIQTPKDGGALKDGVIELRRGVPDLDLKGDHYAQVRIMVNDKYYMKGMAIYSDNIPKGVDLIFNSSKPDDWPMEKHLKPIKSDKDNPFGSSIKSEDEGGQYHYIGKDGKKHLGAINKCRLEGDWGDWKDKLPSQFLAKQNKDLAKKQLNLDIADKMAEYESIQKINNPTIKKQFLMDFADSCDGAAKDLKGAALPRQHYQVLLPLTKIPNDQVYAPNYRDGEKVALIRYPHGGTFEIPILTVNNKNTEARRVISTDAKDAIGINAKVAERLSGADFDGDAVMVIPCNSRGNNVKITSTSPLQGLEGFDPHVEYAERPGMRYMKKENTGMEMGKVSNLITDMTIKGAPEDELAKAVRHSMVVIDAEKHKLDYKQSEKDNDIAYLKKKWQGHETDLNKSGYSEGASTILSRASAEQTVAKRQGSPRINPDTGELEWKTMPDSKRIYTDKNSKTIERTQKSYQMAETRDARTLSSGYQIEEIYADYANKMKAMANNSRKEYLATPTLTYSATAKKTYKPEVDSLNSKLNLSEMNAPLERQAQTMTNAAMKAKKMDNPDMDYAMERKLSQQTLDYYRGLVGAKRKTLDITDREWEAIQAGAISDTTLTKIMRYADNDKLRERATPSNKKVLSSAQKGRISALKASGYTNAEIADMLRISTSTVSNYLKQ